MGLIRRSFNIATLGIVRGRSRKQRMAIKQLKATQEGNAIARGEQPPAPRPFSRSLRQVLADRLASRDN